MQFLCKIQIVWLLFFSAVGFYIENGKLKTLFLKIFLFFLLLFTAKNFFVYNTELDRILNVVRYLLVTESALNWTALRHCTSFNFCTHWIWKFCVFKIREGSSGEMYKAPPVRYIHLYYIIIELRSDSAPVWRHTASQRDFIGVDMTELGTQLYVYGDKIPTLKSAYFWLSNRRREWKK